MSHRLSSHYYKHRVERPVLSWMGARALMVRSTVRQRAKEKGLETMDTPG